MKKSENFAEEFQVVDGRKLYQCQHGLFLGTPCSECPDSMVMELFLETTLSKPVVH